MKLVRGRDGECWYGCADPATACHAKPEWRLHPDAIDDPPLPPEAHAFNRDFRLCDKHYLEMLLPGTVTMQFTDGMAVFVKI